jgi:hypothetical protein
MKFTMKKKPLKHKVFYNFVFFNILTTLVLLTGGVLCLKRTLLQKDIDASRILAEKIHFAVERIFKSASHELQLISSHPVLRDELLSDEIKKIELQKLMLLMKKFEQISILDLNGRVKFSTSYNYIGNMKYSDCFNKTLIENSTQVSPAYFTPSPRHLVFSFTCPIFNKDRDIIAVLCAQLNLNEISSFFANNYFGESGYSMLIDHYDRVLAGGEKEDILMPISADLKAKLKSKNDEFMYNNYGLRHYSLHKGDKFTVLISRSYSEVYGVMNDSYARMLFYTIVVICMILFLGFYSTKFIFKQHRFA